MVRFVIQETDERNIGLLESEGTISINGSFSCVYLGRTKPGQSLLQ